MTSDQVPLYSLHLIPLSETHIAKTYTWIQNPELRRLFLMRGEVSWRAHLGYFHKILNDPSQVWYAVIADDAHVGNCGIMILSRENKECTLWIYIGDTSLRGRGIGTSATRMLIEKAFNFLDMNRIIIHVAGYNNQALRMYRTLGFTEISPSREEEWLNRGCEIIRMALARYAP